jgi:hypothetical protein
MSWPRVGRVREPAGDLEAVSDNDFTAARDVLARAAMRLLELYSNGVAPLDTSVGLKLSPMASECYRFLLLQDQQKLIDIIVHLAVAVGRRDV